MLSNNNFIKTNDRVKLVSEYFNLISGFGMKI